MENELFYSNLNNEKEMEEKLINLLENYSSNTLKQVFLLKKPLGENNEYNYSEGCFLLIPEYRILFIDFNNAKESEDFEDYLEDILSDLGSISNKYKYKDQLKRPRYWKDDLVSSINYNEINSNFDLFLKDYKLEDDSKKRNIELIISLFTGSINDIERVKGDVPDSLLDKIKKKIILFDGQQTRFLYQERDSKVIKIQGLAGTGKTELLLHKLKTLYTKSTNTKIAFTCYNKILHDTLSKRIPIFFDFMKVEEQIKWNERLWCCRGWGSKYNHNIGLYSFICQYYDLRFYSYRDKPIFSEVCSLAIEELHSKQFEPFFDYILIDESQDFPETFFELCKLVTKETLYIAGDIFQNIFNIQIENEVQPDFLLNKCYRTDPNTLMFAHALGMGLFEKNRISWLEKEGLESCGYNVVEKDDNYILSRQPLKRFEDLEMTGINSIELILANENIYLDKILEIIKKIKTENPTVKPDDIAIMFLKNNKDNYKLATELNYLIADKLEWEANIGYETQKIIPNKIMITNRNNIKGLEYPFVICLGGYISNYFSERNSVYMMLTRSFIQSYLILDERSTELNEILITGLNEILTTGKMTIKKATEEEQKFIAANILEYTQKTAISLDELIDQSMKIYEIDMKYRKILEELISIEIDLTSYDNEEIIEFIKSKKELFVRNKK